MYKNEMIAAAALRKAFEETRLRCEFQSILSVEETLFPRVEDMATDAHTVNVCCHLTVMEVSEITLDRHHEDFQWLDKDAALALSLHDAVRRPLLLALGAKTAEAVYVNILFLTVTDQSTHPMGRYVDLHCTYDFNNWLEGFSCLPYSICYFNMYESFVVDGPLVTEQKVLAIVEREKITLVIFPNLYYEINASFLQMLRAASVKSLVIFFDDSARFEDTNRYYLGHCDYIITHESERALALYKPYGLTPEFFPCFPSLSFYGRLLCESAGAVSEIHDVSFIGANIADRSIYLSSLIEAGLAVSFYGSGWPNGCVTQSVMLQIFRDSRISLNFTKSGVNDGIKQLKARAFEIMLSGGFLLTEYDPELISYFEVGAEIDTFSTPEECTEKVKFYLENPLTREAMRQRGTEKCRRDFNFETAWSQYLERIETHKMKQDAIAVIGTFPARAIRSFISWNSKYFFGRLSNKQIYLAADQLRWAIRDVTYLSRVHSGKVWLVVFSKLIFCPVRRIKRICTKAFLLLTRWFLYQKLRILENR